MILLNGKYKIESDASGFTLTRFVDGKDVHGNPKLQGQNSYYATFRGCLLGILDNEGKDCPDVPEVLMRYNALEKVIIEIKTKNV